MGILVKVGNFNNKGFGCADSAKWEEIIEACPIVEEVFRNEYSKDGGGNISPGRYFVKYSDKRLRSVMSELDKFKDNLSFKNGIYDLTEKIWKTVHNSMYLKKDLEVQVLWSEKVL